MVAATSSGVAATSSGVAAAAGFAPRAGARLARTVEDETRSAGALLSATSGVEGAGAEGATVMGATVIGASDAGATDPGAVSAETGAPSTAEAGAGAGAVAGSAADGQGCSVAPGGQAGFSGLQSGHSHGRNGLKSGVNAVYGQPLRRKLIGTNE